MASSGRPRWLGPFLDAPRGCNEDSDCQIAGAPSTAQLNRCFDDLAPSSATAGGCGCADYWDGPECATRTDALQTNAIMWGVVVAYALLVILLRFPTTVAVLRKRLWLRNASAWGIIWAWCMILTSVALHSLNVVETHLPIGALKDVSRILGYVQLVFCLLSVLTIMGAFVESATTMRKLRDLNRATVPIRVFAFAVFVTLTTLIVTDHTAAATYVAFGVVCVLLILSIAGPLFLYFKFAVAHGVAKHNSSRRSSKKSRASRLGRKRQTLPRAPSRLENKRVDVDNYSEAPSSAAASAGGPRKSCCVIAKELVLRVLSGKDDVLEPIDSENYTFDQSSSRNDRSRDDSSLPRGARSRATTADDFALQDERGVDVTAVAELMHRRASQVAVNSGSQDADSPGTVSKQASGSSMAAGNASARKANPRSRAGSKESTLSVVSSLPSDFGGGGRGGRRGDTSSVRLQLNKVRDMLRGAVATGDASQQSTRHQERRTKREKKQQDRVLSFLSRVIGLAMRLALCLGAFLGCTAANLVLGSNYYGNDYVTWAPPMILEFAADLALVGVAHSILWFLQLAQRKRLMMAAAKERRATRMYGQGGSFVLRGDSKEAFNSTRVAETPSAGVSASNSRRNSFRRTTSKQKAQYYLDDATQQAILHDSHIVDMNRIDSELDSELEAFGVVTVVEEGEEGEEDGDDGAETRV